MRLTATAGISVGALAMAVVALALSLRAPLPPSSEPIAPAAAPVSISFGSATPALHEPPSVVSPAFDSSELKNQLSLLAGEVAALSQRVTDSVSRMERLESDIRRGTVDAPPADVSSVMEPAPEERKQQRTQLLDQLLAEPASQGDAASAEELLRSSSAADGGVSLAQIQAVQCGQRLCRINAELATAQDLQGFVINLKEKLVAAGDGSWNPPLEVHTDELTGGQLQARFYIPRAGASLPD